MSTGKTRTRRYDINKAAQIVGVSGNTLYDPPRAFLWQDGVMYDLNDLTSLDPNVVLYYAYAINDLTQIVGVASGIGAFLWQNGTVIGLGSLGGDRVTYTSPYDINELGQVVGSSLTPSLYEHAFLWENGVMSDLGTLGGLESRAAGINNLGQVVGASGADGRPAAFLWENGVMVDLNDLIPPDSGWELWEASGISDSGEIVGYGYYNGNIRAFLLRPGCSHSSDKPLLSNNESFVRKTEPQPSPLGDFDIRAQERLTLQAPSEERIKTVEKLKVKLGARLKVYWNFKNGTPRSLLAYGSYLSESSGKTPTAIALDFLENNFDLFGLTKADAANFQLQRNFQTAHNGITHLTFSQSYQQIPVFEGQIRFNIDHQGRIISMGGEYYPGVDIPVTPGLFPPEALKAAVRDVAPGVVFEPEILSGPSGPTRMTVFQKGPFNETDAFHRASLVIFPMRGQFRLAWQVVFHKNSIERYLILVDAQTSEILYRTNLVRFNQPQGLVFEEDPDDGSQVLKSFRGDPGASPQGWLYQNNGTYFSLGGNNTCTQEDRDDDNIPGYSPTASDGHFEFSFLNAYESSGGSDVDTDLDTAITNLFYGTNVAHDYYYQLRFDGAAGNFQRDNMSKGGLGNDEVQADAQDAWDTGARNNANFYTPPDGFDLSFGRPRMQMYLFTSPPYRNADGDFDGKVIIHEYTHGVSNRLVGGPADVTALDGIQSGAMGEGWGDWFAASIYNDPIIGEYVTGNPTTGIRRYALDNNPLTYGDLCKGPSGCKVHDDGEIWSATLWDLRQYFLDAYGYAAGKQQVEQLIVDGMKFSPGDPTMLDMRDAILQADVAIGGSNQGVIWEAFACRGMGFSATTLDHNDPNPVEAFDLPDGRMCTDLSVTMDDWPDPVKVGNNLTYTLTATNYGYASALGVTLTDPLPTTVTFVSATPSQGGCVQSSLLVTCDLGILAVGASATVDVIVIPNQVGILINTATVTGNITDPDESNNVAREATQVKLQTPIPKRR